MMVDSGNQAAYLALNDLFSILTQKFDSKNDLHVIGENIIIYRYNSYCVKQHINIQAQFQQICQRRIDGRRFSG